MAKKYKSLQEFSQEAHQYPKMHERQKQLKIETLKRQIAARKKKGQDTKVMEEALKDAQKKAKKGKRIRLGDRKAQQELLEGSFADLEKKKK